MSEKIYILKFILIGDSGVGKSSLMAKQCKNEAFNALPRSTIGVDFMCFETNMNGIPYKIHIWDTAGQERFRSITRSYYKNKNATLLIIDVSKYKHSGSTIFQLPELRSDITSWIRELRAHSPFDSACTPVFVIGSKTDKRSGYHYTYDELRECVMDLDMKEIKNYYEVSALTGENVKECFNDIVTSLNKNHLMEYQVLDMESNQSIDNCNNTLDYTLDYTLDDPSCCSVS